ncbi:MAG: 2'-5' RNA ligase [archaeon GW2011_AR19]|nr:MAG: 2'-5' RNA ligase [archaeon GW2011_AR19]
MRAFISLDLPAEIIKEIKKIQNALPKFVGKKTESENLHLTLKFLGEVSEEKIEQIRENLKKIKLSPRDDSSKDIQGGHENLQAGDTAVPSGEPQKFQVSIDSIGVFSKKVIRIVWLHLTNCDALQREIDEKLSDLFGKEQRFMGHLTIARVKNIKNSPRDDSSKDDTAVPSGEPKKEFLEKLKKIKIPKINFMVENFKLKSSTFKSEGPVYEDIEIYNLK